MAGIGTSRFVARGDGGPGFSARALPALLSALALTATAAFGQEAANPWPKAAYNPQPAEGDVVLPMPRGGSAVTDAEFRERLFPMDEDVAGYAWFDGPRSAAGRMRRSVG